MSKSAQLYSIAKKTTILLKTFKIVKLSQVKTGNYICVFFVVDFIQSCSCLTCKEAQFHFVRGNSWENNYKITFKQYFPHHLNKFLIYCLIYSIKKEAPLIQKLP